MTRIPKDIRTLRQYRNSRLYRSLTRTLRVYNRRLLERLHDRGFTDFTPSFPTLLSNLDTRGTRIGVLAMRGGVTRQAAGQLLKDAPRDEFFTAARAAAYGRTVGPGSRSMAHDRTDSPVCDVLTRA